MYPRRCTDKSAVCSLGRTGMAPDSGRRGTARSSDDVRHVQAGRVRVDRRVRHPGHNCCRLRRSDPPRESCPATLFGHVPEVRSARIEMAGKKTRRRVSDRSSGFAKPRTATTQKFSGGVAWLGGVVPGGSGVPGFAGRGQRKLGRAYRRPPMTLRAATTSGASEPPMMRESAWATSSLALFFFAPEVMA